MILHGLLEGPLRFHAVRAVVPEINGRDADAAPARARERVARAALRVVGSARRGLVLPYPRGSRSRPRPVGDRSMGGCMGVKLNKSSAQNVRPQSVRN